MSGAVWLALLGCAVAVLGGLWSAEESRRAAWRASAGIGVALAALLVWWQAAPAGVVGGPLTAPAISGGAPVETVVTLRGAQGRRQVRRVPLSRPIDGGERALWLMVALGLAGAVAQTSRRGARAAVVLPVLGSAVAAATILRAGGAGGGEEEVRRLLASFGGVDDLLISFTVPVGPWTYTTPGAALIVGAGLLAATTAALTWGDGRPERSAWSARLVAVGAALAAGACAWRIVEAGGLPWRPTEGALWAAALMLLGAAFDAPRAGRIAPMVVAALLLVCAVAG